MDNSIIGNEYHIIVRLYSVNDNRVLDRIGVCHNNLINTITHSDRKIARYEYTSHARCFKVIYI